jgi:hypothetical protein
MKKILLIIDDYSENSRTQLVLKKIGFDVLSMQTITGLADKVLGFNPDIIVCFGTQKFTTINVGQKLKEITHLKAKVILILQQGMRPQPSDLTKIRMDILMEAPLIMQKLIEVLANLAGLSVEPIFEKLRKAQLSDPSLGVNKSNAPQPNSEASMIKSLDKVNDTVRANKYQNLVKNFPPIEKKQTTFIKSEIKVHQDDLEKGWDPQLTESINELKKQFVDALFRKKGE